LSKLTNIEKLYFDLYEQRITINEFEEIIYYSNWIKTELTSSEYDDLIILNYKSKEAKSRIKYILREKVNYQNTELKKLVALLSDSLTDNLKWNIESYEYGTSYGIITHTASGQGIQFYHPFDRKTYYSVEHQANVTSYEGFNEFFNNAFPKLEDLLNKVKMLSKANKLTFYYKQDFEDYGKYFDNNYEEPRFSIGEIIGTVDRLELKKELKFET